MRNRSAAALTLWLGSAPILAAQSIGSITGTVRDSTGAAVAGAEVVIGDKRLLTGAQGGFRFDSLPVGTRLLTIRAVGYTPLRSPVRVRNQVLSYDFVLHRAPLLLPTLHSEARRTGIYGTVGDSSLAPLAGVRVQLAGRGGGEAVSDSSGRFAFPVSEGQYVVRIAQPGYAEQRLLVELKKGEGVELAFRVRPSREILARDDDVALLDLSRRLVANLTRDRFSASQLERYGSLGLCDVTGIAGRVRAPTYGLTIILNGTVILDQMSVRDLCSWRADEVELVEFGDTVCRDVTRTLPDMLHVWCTRFTKKGQYGPTPRGALDRRGTQRSDGPFVVIWERR